MSTYQARSAQLRQTVRQLLAELKGVSLQSVPYPRSNAKLAECKKEIQAIRDFEAETTRLRNIDPNLHYEIVFNRKDHVKIGGEITDSNFAADIAIGTPGEFDQVELLNANNQVIKQIIQDERQRLGPIKVRIGIYATMRHMTDYQQGLFEENIAPINDDSYDYRYHIIFKTRNMPVLPATNIDDTITFGIMRITERIDQYQNYGSGWEFYRVEQVFIEITQFQPLTGAGHIPLPKYLDAKCGAKNGLVNPKNEDNECFKWAILCALYPAKYHAKRIGQYKKYYNQLNFENIDFLVQADEIVLKRFERQNPSIALCISEWKGRLSPIYVTDKDIAEGRKMIDLLLISNGEKQHYCWIKNMSRLVASRTKHCTSTLICRWCISHFTHQQDEHDKHVAMCRGIKASPQRDVMPNEKKGNDIQWLAKVTHQTF